MRTTTVRQFIAAPRSAVYRALLDPAAVQQWMVPDGMTSEVHLFEPHVGGRTRISLTYSAPRETGKTSAHTDTHEGRFVELVPDERVVQVIAFESNDPEHQGEMTVRYVLREADGGTEVVGIHENVPPGVSLEDNETGWRMSLGKLARLVERTSP